jgi:GTP cyclohydrolase I
MNWIYSTDVKIMLRYFEEAPTTVGIEDSPGRIGQFMGLQMVTAYMDANPEVTIEELMNEESESKILKAYKPKENE